MDRTPKTVAFRSEGGRAATPCRYGRECMRKDCHFTHLEGRHLDRMEGGALHNHNHNPHHRHATHQQAFHPTHALHQQPHHGGGGGTPCRYDRRCVRPDCHFYHPHGRAMDRPVVASNKPRPCRYGSECYRENCPFFHRDKGRRFPRKRNFGGPKIPVSTISYTSNALQEQEARGYKSAGVLPYRKDDEGKIWVLLGIERRSRGDPTMYLNFLGGMRNQNDTDAVDTAVRLLFDETGKLMSEEKVLEMAKNLRENETTQVLWVAAGKYALFPYEMHHDLDIHERYVPKASNVSVHSLHWVQLSELLACVSQKKDHLGAESGTGLNIYTFLSTTFSDEAAGALLPVQLASS